MPTLLFHPWYFDESMMLKFCSDLFMLYISEFNGQTSVISVSL